MKDTTELGIPYNLLKEEKNMNINIDKMIFDHHLHSPRRYKSEACIASVFSQHFK